MYMEKDDTCLVDQTRGLAAKIHTNDGEVTLDRDHGYPAGANDSEFMETLRSLLRNSGEEMSDRDCARPFYW